MSAHGPDCLAPPDLAQGPLAATCYQKGQHCSWFRWLFSESTHIFASGFAFNYGFFGGRGPASCGMQDLSSPKKRKCYWLSSVRLFEIPWTAAHQAPLSKEILRQEYLSGLPLPSLGDLPDPGMEPRSPALQADSLPSEPPGKSILSLVSSPTAFTEGSLKPLNHKGSPSPIFPSLHSSLW